jgi:hypothetical protein
MRQGRREPKTWAWDSHLEGCLKPTTPEFLCSHSLASKPETLASKPETLASKPETLASKPETLALVCKPETWAWDSHRDGWPATPVLLDSRGKTRAETFRKPETLVCRLETLASKSETLARKPETWACNRHPEGCLKTATPEFLCSHSMTRAETFRKLETLVCKLETCGWVSRSDILARKPDMSVN